MSIKETQSNIYFQFLVNLSRAYSEGSQSWTFETDYTQKLHCYAVSWHKKPPDKQIIFWLKISMKSRKLWQTQFFGINFKGSRIFFFFTKLRFFQQERVLWGWLAGPPVKAILLATNLVFSYSNFLLYQFYNVTLKFWRKNRLLWDL